MVDKKQDLTGKYFGLLKVLEKDLEKSKVFKETYWKCMCECGKETSVSSYHLKEKNKPTRSCGCLRTIKAREACKKYNKYDLTGEYGIGYTSKGEEFYFDYAIAFETAIEALQEKLEREKQLKMEVQNV